MKLVVIGFGQCGGRIADQMAKLNMRARTQRHIEITPGVYAVNTDAADLSGLSCIPSNYKHRILIGGRKTGGHGVGKINELGAEIAREDGDKVIDAIRSTKRFYESDAFLLIASAGGGTGSGALPVMAQHIKERYMDKPVYAVVVLPFEHEETTEERSVYNSALCLKSVNTIADAVIVVDNQRYIRKDASLRNNLTKINELIAEPFYDLLCAGEEKKTKFIGAKTLDAGDIIQTLSGWTAIGFGASPLPTFNLQFLKKQDFRTKSTEMYKGVQAMDEAMSELSIGCNPIDAGRALYLLSAPPKEMNMELVKELGDYLRGLAPKATIRNGDYPREKSAVEVTLVLSALGDVGKIRDYYAKSASLIPEFRRRKDEIIDRLKDMEEVGKDLPSLL
ncbi:MAG: tubulin/FtsZ family protein [Chloroflexota bacterium]|nr:tubulin/FtsZ family protein [Chloroflexota bacterium]